ncbi:MAG: hydrolase [Planctomycetaceae bacterium]|jgi:nicotinamidase-related amidase|nr:hydrolase [Planctomycetaceae bacterium]
MYQRSRSLLSVENSLLLMIDFQERLMPAIENAETVVFRARQLLESAKTFGIRIVVSEQYPQGLGSTVSELRSFIPSDVPVLAKKSFSVCGAESLYNEIEKSPTSKIVLCGVETHICVQQSAFDLLAMGREIVLVTDASGSRSSNNNEIALRRMESAGISLSTTESVMFEWCTTAESPHFKTVSRLAKELM